MNRELFIEVASLLVSQVPSFSTRPADFVALKVGPVAKAFIDKYGDQAPTMVRMVGANVSNIMMGVAPVEKFFTFPESIVANLLEQLSPDGSIVPVEHATPDRDDKPKHSDPLYSQGDIGAVKAMGESVSAKSGGKVLAVSQLGLSEAVQNKLYENEIGTTEDLIRFDASRGLETIVGGPARREILKAYAAATGDEVIID